MSQTTIHSWKILVKVITQIRLGVLGMPKSLQETTSTLPVKALPLAVALQEVQESGISQLGITQYLEIKKWQKNGCIVYTHLANIGCTVRIHFANIDCAIDTHLANIGCTIYTHLEKKWLHSSIFCATMFIQ